MGAPIDKVRSSNVRSAVTIPPPLGDLIASRRNERGRDARNQTFVPSLDTRRTGAPATSQMLTVEQRAELEQLGADIVRLKFTQYGGAHASILTAFFGAESRPRRRRGLARQTEPPRSCSPARDAALGSDCGLGRHCRRSTHGCYNLDHVAR
jgi:hypothetical protein